MVLANSHRRRLLVALTDHNPQGGVQPLEEVHLEEKQLEMHHYHLPLLEEHGYITWNREAHVVTKGPEFGEIRPILELFEENADALPVDWP